MANVKTKDMGLVKKITETLCGTSISSSTVSNLAKGIDENISN